MSKDDRDKAAAAAIIYDRIATKASSVSSVVLRYCTVCGTMKPKEGAYADSPKFVCTNHEGEAS